MALRGFLGAFTSLVIVKLATTQPCPENGAVRLEGVETDSEGLVEICINRRWSKVCGRDWGTRQALVTCRELGFTHGAPLEERDYSATSSYSIFCVGDENHLLHCDRRDAYCSFNAAVKCFTSSQCNETDVRLVDGRTPDDGRVEICLNGVWGSVCDDYWDSMDAAVVCRQLGYNGSSIPLRTHPVLYNGSLFYHLDNLHCNGSELFLSDCIHNGVGVHDCWERLEEAGVICNNIISHRECNETDVRLVGGQTPDDGRVEICFDGVWGSVCDDYWDVREATVVCRQLGYNESSMLFDVYNIYSNSSFLYHLGYVYCTGSENTLSECKRNRVSFLDCTGEAGVICNITSAHECNDTDVRLVDGLTYEDGRVEVCFNRVWGSVCDDDWDARDAKVVCRQLGIEGSSIAHQQHYVLSNDSLFYHLDDVRCIGYENKLSECGHSGVGVHDCATRSEEAGVVCNGKVCNETDVQLVGSRQTPGEGEVQICLNGSWGSVCDSNWGYSEARVVCRQLGYDGSYAAGYVFSPIFFFFTPTPSLFYQLEEVTCQGNESLLSDCEHNTIVPNYCYWRGAKAKVTCSYRECNETDVQLAGGQTPDDGRVEICLDGFWGPVCGDGWDYRDATVVCRLLGYERSYPVLSHHNRYSVSHNLDCNGTEENLSYCS